MEKYFILILLLYVTACTQKEDIDESIYPMLFDNNKWGYINDNGDTIIKPIYDKACYFEYGMAIAGFNDKLGIINKDNEFLIKPKYDYICIYSENLLVGMINHNSYIHDLKNDTVYYYEYETAGIWNDKTLVMADKNKKVVLLVLDSMKILPTNYDEIILPRKSFYYGEEVLSIYTKFNNENINNEFGITILNNKIGYIKYTGEVIVEPKYDFGFFFQKTRAIYQFNDKWGIIDVSGKEVISPKYDAIFREIELNEEDEINKSSGIKRQYNFLEISYEEAIPFEEGMVQVKIGNRWGVADTKGVEIVKPIYDWVRNFSDGYAIVHNKNKYGCLNEKGELVLPCKYKELNSFYHGLSLLEENKEFWYINIKGEKVLGPYQLAKEFTYPETIVKVNDKFGIIDTTGKFLIPPKYDKIYGRFKDYYKYKYYHYFTWIDNKMGYIDNNLKTIIEPSKYDDVGDLSKGIIIVTLNKKDGLVDSTGKEILSPKYERIYDFYIDIAQIIKNDSTYYINKKGKIIFGPIKDRARNPDLSYYLNHYELINYSN